MKHHGMNRWAVCLLGLCLAGRSGAQELAVVEESPPAYAPVADTPFAEIASCAEGPCGRPGQCWIRAEALWWWIDPTRLPPLVSTSPAGTAEDDAGVLGTPGTSIVIGNENVNDQLRIGTRLTIGGWFDAERTCGVELGFFVLEGQATQRGAAGDGAPILARPFLTPGGAQDAELVSFPDTVSGAVFVDANSNNLWGLNLDYRELFCCGGNWRIDFLSGYRFLRYDENLTIREDLAPQGDDIVPGTRIQIADSFSAQNQLHAWEFGFVGDLQHDRWSFEFLAKLGVGLNYQDMNIDGITLVTVPGFGSAANVGGLLALQSNIGHFTKSEVCLLPELGFNLGWQATDHLRFQAGYTIFWLTDIIRAAEQIDLRVNRALLPPVENPDAQPRLPTVLFKDNQLWVQGFNIGFEYRY
jgi:hypothetical protein